MKKVIEVNVYQLLIFVGLTTLGSVISIILDKITKWKEIIWRLLAGAVSGLVAYFTMPESHPASLIMIGYSATDFLKRAVGYYRAWRTKRT